MISKNRIILMLNKRILLILFLLFIVIGTISVVGASGAADELTTNATVDEMGIEYDTNENNVVDELGTGESEEGALSVDDGSSGHFKAK